MSGQSILLITHSLFLGFGSRQPPLVGRRQAGGRWDDGGWGEHEITTGGRGGGNKEGEEKEGKQ